MAECIFCNIGQGKTKSDILFQDDRCFVIRDIHPAAPTHLLIVPLHHLTYLSYVGPGQEALVGHLFAVAEELARREEVTVSGYRLAINQGRDAGQGIDHLHVHLLGGKRLPALG
ncbi:MAG: HIT domain-containing protein [Chloroflexi bacterium]|nr:HIT domain-containing protein [Chloroflexota bacterium]